MFYQNIQVHDFCTTKRILYKSIPDIYIKKFQIWYYIAIFKGVSVVLILNDQRKFIYLINLI